MEIKYLDIPYDTPEWYSFRKNSTLGASEVATCMGMNPYECKLQLFHRKLGILPDKKKTLPMLLGNMSENLIAELYSYYEKDEVKFIENISKKNKVREVESTGGICTNSLYKNLFASLDRKCMENGESIALEFKTKSMMSYRMYANEINPAEAIQLATQLIVSRMSKDRIVYLIENRQFEVFEMDLKTAMTLEKRIVKESNDFCDRVAKGKILLNQIANAKDNYNMALAEKLTQELYKLEPQENTQAYLDYYTDIVKQRKASVPMKGTDELLKKALQDKKISEQIKKLTKQQVSLRCDLVNSMEDKLEIDFGKLGKVNIAGKFQNKIK